MQRCRCFFGSFVWLLEIVVSIPCLLLACVETLFVVWYEIFGKKTRSRDGVVGAKITQLRLQISQKYCENVREKWADAKSAVSWLYFLNASAMRLTPSISTLTTWGLLVIHYFEIGHWFDFLNKHFTTTGQHAYLQTQWHIGGRSAGEKRRTKTRRIPSGEAFSC